MYRIGRKAFEAISRVEGLTPKGVNTSQIVSCSRCSVELPTNENEDFTSGYYDCRKGYWAKFVNKNEKFICDQCMWSDDRYQAVYGKILFLR